MSGTVQRIIEGTITGILVYLVLTNARGFAQVASAAGQVYAGSVRALQGR